MPVDDPLPVDDEPLVTVVLLPPEVCIVMLPGVLTVDETEVLTLVTLPPRYLLSLFMPVDTDPLPPGRELLPVFLSPPGRVVVP